MDTSACTYKAGVLNISQYQLEKETFEEKAKCACYFNNLQYQHEEESFPNENLQHLHDINETGMCFSGPRIQLLLLKVTFFRKKLRYEMPNIRSKCSDSEIVVANSYFAKLTSEGTNFVDSISCSILDDAKCGCK